MKYPYIKILVWVLTTRNKSDFENYSPGTCFAEWNLSDFVKYSEYRIGSSAKITVVSKIFQSFF